MRHPGHAGDDASQDGTLDLARALAERDARVSVITQDVNAGPAAARNRAIEAT
ncbi:MAG: glycosyltransferase, partial [Gemmatimonadota bacterium]